MTPINHEALDAARQLIRRDFGEVSDLPEDLRNTVVNTYYEYSFVGVETKGEFAWPSSIALEGGLMKGLEKFFGDADHLEAAVRTLPDVIRGIRGMRDSGKHEGYRLTVSL